MATSWHMTQSDLALQPSQQMLHLMVKGATEYALILMDPDERIIYWNRGAELIFGYDESEFLGESILRIFTPEDVKLGVADAELMKARTLGWANDERWHKRANGERFWANGVVTCMRSENGQVIGYSKVLRDQTLRKETEDKLKSAVSEMTHFNHVLSHDLKEPLRTVVTCLDLAREQLPDGCSSEFSDFLETASTGAHRMRTMLNDMLSFVRADRKDAPIETTDSSAICDMAISNLKLAIDESKAVVTRTPLPIVCAVPTQLTQVFQNLIGNAIKFRRMNESARVYIGCHADGDDWLFQVCDNGIGMPMEKAHKVFEAFERLHDKEDYPGTGLGLFICRKIIERHRGKIWVESAPGSDTRVSFTIPRRSSDGPPNAGNQAKAQ